MQRDEGNRRHFVLVSCHEDSFIRFWDMKVQQRNYIVTKLTCEACENLHTNTKISKFVVWVCDLFQAPDQLTKACLNCLSWRRQAWRMVNPNHDLIILYYCSKCTVSFTVRGHVYMMSPTVYVCHLLYVWLSVHRVAYCTMSLLWLCVRVQLWHVYARTRNRTYWPQVTLVRNGTYSFKFKQFLRCLWHRT